MEKLIAFIRRLLSGGSIASSAVEGVMAATNGARAALKAEFVAAASSHRVGIDPEMMAYLVTREGFVAHVPLTGINRYQQSDFEAGAPIQLLIVRGNTQSLPDGSYVVKARYQAGTGSGTAVFLDRTGAEVARRDLTVLDWHQATLQFPGLYPNHEPQSIPVITSSHQVYDWKQGYWRTIVDCAGWTPYRVVWYGLFVRTPDEVEPDEAKPGDVAAGAVSSGQR